VLQFEWLCREKIADGPLVAKWRKPGYEILCSMLAIQKGNHNFGTTSHCRVPLRLRASQQRVTPDVQTGGDQNTCCNSAPP
jgi:bud site selection protein 31